MMRGVIFDPSHKISSMRVIIFVVSLRGIEKSCIVGLGGCIIRPDTGASPRDFWSIR